MSSTTPAFVCSMCRKPIAVGGKVIRCAVSTCNTGRVKLVFCSPGCWDSHLPNARLRPHAFGHAKGAREQIVQRSAERPVRLGHRIRRFQLAQDLGLADHHRIQAGRHAEKMMNRLAAFVMVKARAQRRNRGLAGIGQEVADQALQVHAIFARNHHLHAIAGGKNQRFRHAFPGFQLRQRRGQGGVGKSQALPDLHRGRFVADACDQQLHCVKVSRRPLCAAQVMAEQPRAAIAMMAAFLPRHPAVTRRNTMAR